MADPLGAAGLREAVLRGWLEQPARFREDANAEDDAARAGYRDRLLIELLQNAADAAETAGRVLIRLRAGTLSVANTGKTLTAEGLLALCTLRASAKRDENGSIGRFGTGFAAVLAATDEPVIVSGKAAIRWSASATRDLLSGTSVESELNRRGGQVPVLRMPFATDPTPLPDGYATEVRLPLRNGFDAEELLGDIGGTALLLLEAIDEIVIESPAGRRVLTAVRAVDGSVTVDGVTWLRAGSSSPLPAELAAAAGPEARSGDIRAVAWWPEGGWPGLVPQVLHAPTPTDDVLSLPVLVVADVPVEAHRRRTIPGPLRSFALGVAADAVVALAAQLPGTAVLRLVPTGLAANQLDAELSQLVVDRLRAAWPLPGRRLLDLGRATPRVHAFLNAGDEPEIPDLLPSTWPVESQELRVLGVERLETADVVGLLSAGGVDRDPEWWGQAWAALADTPDRDALAALPVPLLGGRMAPGPRGILHAREGVPAGLEQRLQLLDPVAAHPLQLSLGAIDAGPVELLEALRVEVAASFDDDDTGLAAIVLTLAATLLPGELGWLADLALTDSHGEIAPAGELVLPGSALDLALRDDAPLGVVSGELVREFGAPALLAVGVGDGLVVVRGDNAVADLDGGEEFLDEVYDGAEEPVGIRDLEWLRWPEGLALLGNLEPAALPYLRWWCAREPMFDGRTPGEVLAPTADPLLQDLYDAADVDPATAALIGCRTALPAEPGEVTDLLQRLGDGHRTIGRDQLRAVLIHLARIPVPVHASAPEFVRAVDGSGEVVVVPPSSAVLVDAPDLLPLLGNRCIVPAPLWAAAALSEWLGVPLASSLGRFDVAATEPLTVNDADGVPVRIAWRVIGEDVWSDGPEGAGRARAWQADEWSRRHAYVEEARGRLDPMLRLERDLE